MPLLAIIRVFGGVPWNHVLSSLCITLTTAIFTGALSFLFSIYNRQAHLVIIRTFLVCFLFYIIPPIILQFLQLLYRVTVIPKTALYYINPFIVMSMDTTLMLRPSSAALTQPWQLHCVIMLGLSSFLLAISTLCVRKVARRQATGQAGIFTTRKERRLANGKGKIKTDRIGRTINIWPVKGPPIALSVLTPPVCVIRPEPVTPTNSRAAPRYPPLIAPAVPSTVTDPASSVTDDVPVTATPP